ncbi:hypothetical protein M378DRAFT_157320 [Amanita muscaria Koide BX008]|uniref:Uncharacterized protein n=1 Tax=Amanita muscaria (strain Koide BX008) TaxID=946122 RepID=A0A0C2TPG0_AMAMK|nr:hypothetical protein M378DRAFT_157320 [Amanita muscaria Koide BX008]
MLWPRELKSVSRAALDSAAHTNNQTSGHRGAIQDEISGRTWIVRVFHEYQGLTSKR